eukprot:Sspe_Gene.98481::Locus_71897_Transcript_1_6_Confidence_0.400_Length_1285::g.98481::m.98481
MYIWFLAGSAICIGILLNRRRKPLLSYDRNSELIRKVLSVMPTLNESYIPTPYLVGGVLQTISAEVDSKHINLPYETERLLLPRLEGSNRLCCPSVVPEGQISLDWVHSTRRDAPVVIIIPGLTGDSTSPYVRRLADSCRQAGFTVACFNPRGRGGNSLTTPFMYSAGYTEDLRRAIAHIAKTHPKNPLFAVGFSLGANYLAKYVGEEGEGCPLKAAVCIACPVDCLLLSNNLHRSFIGRFLLDPILVKSVHKVLESIEEVIQSHPDINVVKARTARNMLEFDGAAIAPMMGFTCASEYYRNSASGLHLPNIRVPTLFLHAWNDPIVPGKLIHRDDFEANPFLLSVMTRDGGHSMDWPTGLRMSPWSPRVVREFIEAILTHHN